MRLILAGVMSGMLALAAAAQAPTPASLVERLSWLEGCWRQDDPKRTVEEHWLAPAGGTMLGVGRTVAGGKTVAYEFTLIEEKDGRLVFTASPSGQQTTSFTEIERGDTSVVFENAAHDFPQRVIYRRQPDGSLLGRVEGTEKGQQRAFDVPMKRVACGGNAR